MTIGPAGENLVKFSYVMTDYTRAAGRPGLGMVMGSKKLKAIIVKGGVEKPIYDKESLRKAKTEFTKVLLKDPITQRVGQYGTLGGLEPLNELGILLTKYFQRGYFEKIKNIGLEEYEKDTRGAGYLHRMSYTLQA